MTKRFFRGSFGKTRQNMQTRLFFALSLLLVAGCVAGCEEDDAPSAAPTPSAKPRPNFADLIASARPAPSGSAAMPPVASAMPSASAIPQPSALASAAATDKKAAAPSASAKSESTPKKDPEKPATSATAAAPRHAHPHRPRLRQQRQSPADLVAAQIDSVFLEKKTFAAKFKQEHTQKVAGVTKKSTGQFFFERPNKMSFRYDAPSKNRIVSDGQTLKVYIGEDNQMFVQSVDKTEYPGAFAFLMGKGMGPSFNFGFNDKAKFDGGPVLLGKPKDATPHYESILFYVDKVLLEKKDPGVIRRILIVDAQGNRNRFDLEGATQPEKIDPAEFTFTPPPGTNITQN
jgi:outer membrane lipoprotein carrier protein